MIFIIIGLVLIVWDYVIFNDIEKRFTNAISVIEILKSNGQISEESAEEILSQLQWSKIMEGSKK